MAGADDTLLKERSRGAMGMEVVLTATISGPGSAPPRRRPSKRRTISAHAPRGKPVLRSPDAGQGESLIVGLVSPQP